MFNGGILRSGSFYADHSMRVQTFLSLNVLVAVLSVNSACFNGFDIDLTPFSLKVCSSLNLHAAGTRFPPERGGVFPVGSRRDFLEIIYFPLWQ